MIVVPLHKSFAHIQLKYKIFKSFKVISGSIDMRKSGIYNTK